MKRRIGLRARTDFPVIARDGAFSSRCRGIEVSPNGIIIDRGTPVGRPHGPVLAPPRAPAARTRAPGDRRGTADLVVRDPAGAQVRANFGRRSAHARRAHRFAGSPRRAAQLRFNSMKIRSSFPLRTRPRTALASTLTLLALSQAAPGCLVSKARYDELDTAFRMESEAHRQTSARLYEI